MEWFYVQGGEQQGPVSEADLILLRSTGVLNDATLVWRAGMPEWVPFHSLQVGLESSSGPGDGGSSQTVGVGEEEKAGPAAVAAVGASVVSGPGSSPTDGAGEPVGDPTALVPEDYEVEIESCIRRAWDLMKGDFWPIVGISALVLVAYVGASSVPFLGSVLPLFFSAPLFAGLYYYYLLLIRGKEASVGEAFSGFSRNLGNLVVLSLVMVMGGLIVMIPGFVICAIGSGVAAGGGGERNAVMVVMVVIGAIVAIVPAIYLQVAWMFAILLCIDRMIGFWDAVTISMRTVHKHFFSLWLFLFVIGLLAMGGMLALCVGVFVAVPLGMVATVYLYEDIFGKRGNRSGAR